MDDFVGKTTFLRAIAGDERTYIGLDDPRVVDLARNDPALFMQRYPGPVLIDEIQYAPGLLPHIKLSVDGRPRTVLAHCRCLDAAAA